MSTTLQEPSVSLPGGLESVLSVLSAALDVGQAAELWQVPDRGLAGAAVECGRLTSRMQALLVRLLGEVHARDLALRSGACSTTAWTRHALNQTPREARTLVVVATALRIGMATTGAAFAAGELSLAQAAAITTTVGELPDDVPAEVRERAEAELVGYADRFDAQQLTRLAHTSSPWSRRRSGRPATPRRWSGRSGGPGAGGSCSSPRTGTAPSSSAAG